MPAHCMALAALALYLMGNALGAIFSLICGGCNVPSFLPNFCTNTTVLLTILLAELFAIVLALSDVQSGFWQRVALISLFVQWVVLGSAALLCLSRRWLAGLGALTATCAVLAITQAVTLACSLSAIYSLNPGPDSHAGSFIMRNLAIAGIIALVCLRYFYVRHAWREQINAEARARLQALQARIRPHFLFNTLNTIASLIPQRPEDAEQAVLDLADLLRSALVQRSSISLAEELELTRRYVALERLRMGERLNVDWQLLEPLPWETPIPPLLLQPLVENAIRHGLQQLPNGGVLTVRIAHNAHALHFTISNPCALHGISQHGQQIAQENVRQRLALAYPLAAPLTIGESAGTYQISFSIPLARD